MADEKLNYVEIEVSRKMVDMEHTFHSDKTGKDYARIIGPEGSSFSYPVTGLHVRKDDKNKIYFVRPEGTEIQLRYSQRVEGVPDDAPKEEKWKTVTKTVTIEDLKEMYAQDRQEYRDRIQNNGNGEQGREANNQHSDYVNMSVPSDWGYEFESKKGEKMVSVSISIRENGESAYWSFVMPAQYFKESQKEQGMSFFGFPRENAKGEDYIVHLRNSEKQEDGNYKEITRDVSSVKLKEYVEAAKERSKVNDRFVNVEISEKLVRTFTSNNGKELAAVSVPVYPTDDAKKAIFYEVVIPADRIKDSSRDGMIRVSMYRLNPDGEPYVFNGRHSVKDMDTGEYKEEVMTFTSEDVADRFRISSEKYQESRESNRTIADEMNDLQEEEAVRHRGR